MTDNKDVNDKNDIKKILTIRCINMEWVLLVHKRPFLNLIHPSVRPDETSIAINLQIEK